MKWKRWLTAAAALAGAAALPVLCPLTAQAEEIKETIPMTEVIYDAEFDVRVDILTPPQKTVYRVGEALDTTGLTLELDETEFGTWGFHKHTATLENDPAHLSVESPDTSAAGVKSVTVYYSIWNDVLSHYESDSASFEIIVTDVGDVNVDGYFDASDLTAMQDALHGKTVLTGNAAQNADFNEDGTTDIFDLALMKRHFKQNATECMDLTPVVKQDVTNALTENGWTRIFWESPSKTLTIRSVTDLEYVSKQSFQPAVVRDLQKTYDADFFKDNILILHYGLHGGRTWVNAVDGIAYRSHSLTVTETEQAADPSIRDGALLTRIELPRSQWNGNNAVWTPAEGSYVSKSDGYAFTYLQLEYWASQIGAELSHDIYFYAGQEPRIIRSTAELTEYAGMLTDETGIAELLRIYPDEFFAENALCIGTADHIWGTSLSTFQIIRSEGTITADIAVDPAIGCEAGIYLEMLTIPKADAENDPVIRFRKFTHPGYTTTDGTTTYYETGVSHYQAPVALAVTNSSFGEEHEVTFYWAYTVGLELYADRQLIGSYAVSADASQFSDTYEVVRAVSTETLLDDVEVWENNNEQFSITWAADKAIVTFMKSKATDEEIRVEIPYPES